MRVPPAVPQEAIDGAEAALVATEAAATAKSADGLDRAVREWQKVVEIAPWWPQAYLNLGAVLQKADRPIEAAQALRLYLMANPLASNDQEVRMEIYKLEYETKRTQASVAGSRTTVKR